VSANDCDGLCYTLDPRYLEELANHVRRYFRNQIAPWELSRCYSCYRDHAYEPGHGDQCDCLEKKRVASLPGILEALIRDHNLVYDGTFLWPNALEALAHV
jgi:hypothetical protein